MKRVLHSVGYLVGWVVHWLLCQHVWLDCRCRYCSAINHDRHNWCGCICESCGQVRDTDHKLSQCVCVRCKQTFHRLKSVGQGRDKVCVLCGLCGVCGGSRQVDCACCHGGRSTTCACRHQYVEDEEGHVASYCSVCRNTGKQTCPACSGLGKRPRLREQYFTQQAWRSTG